MKKIVLALLVLALSVGLVADNAMQALKVQPKVLSTSQNREDIVVYEQDFENGMGEWYSMMAHSQAHGGILVIFWYRMVQD